MIKGILYSLFLLPLIFVASCEKSTSSPDKEPFQDAVNRFESAWNNHDPKGMADFWATDGTLLSPWSNNVYAGRDEIVKHFEKEQADGMKDSQIKLVIEKIRFIDPETAFVDADLTITGMKVAGEAAVPFHDHGVFLFVKRDGKWKVLEARPY